MNTNALKKFAQKARNLLLEDVSKRFLYWGFDKKGSILHTVEATGGGYLFRGEAHDDTSIPPKWNSLVSAVGRHSVQDIIEEAAYTWFNRLMAIKILEQNGYDQPVLAYAAADLNEPVILRNAKKGIYPTSSPQEIQTLKRRLAGANDDEALAALLVSYCRNHQLLNRIFGHLDDYTELLIPGALLAKGGLLELINGEGIISDEDYQEVELIGWLYQFYISDKKDDVFAGFKKKKKARAEDIPAATQIFTPKWIVKYLVENTVGRIWLDLHPESPIRETMKYLVEPENHTPDDPIINVVTELKVLDPAVGSGHFLVVAFDLLMQMYQEEGYSKRKAVESIIEYNLYGLDICPRAAGLANFAILLKAAQYHGEVLREAHFPKVFAMPESFDFTQQQVGSFLGTDELAIIDEVHAVFKVLKQGQNIGSALILNLSETSQNQLLAALERDWSSSLDLTDQMTMKRLSPFAKVASILTDLFPVVVTNPPYMSKRNMNMKMVEYFKINYPNSSADLFAVFIDLCAERNQNSGLVGMITQHSWMFLGSFESLRISMMNNSTVRSMLHLGPRLFDEISGEIVQSTAFIQKKQPELNFKGDYYRLVQYKSSGEKEKHFIQRDHHFSHLAQSDFSLIPGMPLAYWASPSIYKTFNNSISFEKIGKPRQGLGTTNNTKFLRLWHEIDIRKACLNPINRDHALNSKQKWFCYTKGAGFKKWYGNLDTLINWESNGRDIKDASRGRNPNIPRSASLYFRTGISWGLISTTNFSCRLVDYRGIFDVGGSMSFPQDKSKEFLLALLNSKLSKMYLEIINPTMNNSVGDVKKIPLVTKFDDEIKGLVLECIEIAKNDWNSREISWNFSRSPLLKPLTSIALSLAQWESDVLDDLLSLRKLEERINEKLIAIYGLEDELKSEVELKDITILQDELKLEILSTWGNSISPSREKSPISRAVVIKNLLSFSVGCFLGRYRLDKPGLNIAYPLESQEELSAYKYNGITFEIDDDAIIPIMGVESPFSDDIVQRVQQFVLMVWGEDSYTENLNFINEALGEDLEKYLTRKFWDFHRKMYKKRPIYWQFASPNGAFKVLTYMHRMNRFTVQKIRQNYLFKQINYLESEIARLKANEASLNSTEARKLDHFRSNLMECRDYDLLLKDVADRQIEFDLDDGVVENYKLFEGVVSNI